MVACIGRGLLFSIGQYECRDGVAADRAGFRVPQDDLVGKVARELFAEMTDLNIRAAKEGVITAMSCHSEILPAGCNQGLKRYVSSDGRIEYGGVPDLRVYSPFWYSE